MPLFKKKSEKRHSAANAPQARPTPSIPPTSIPSTTAKPPPYPTQRKLVQTGIGLPNGGALASLRNEQPTEQQRRESLGKEAGLRREFSDEDNQYGDLGTGTKQVVNTELETKSRLCRTLPEVLHDNGALAYFIQFMQAQNAVHLVQFWLATESFSTASWSRLRSESLTNASKSIAEQKPRAGSKTTLTDSLLPQADSQMSGESNVSIPHLSQPNVTQDGMANSGQNNNDQTESKEPSSQTNEANVKTHSRAKSDSLIAIERTKPEASPAELGHRRTNSWKGVDPRTAVERDASNIFTRYLCKDAPLPVGITDEIRLDVIAKMCPQEGWLNPDCFKTAQNFVFDSMEMHFFQPFLRSEFHCKYQIDVLTTGKAYLADILYNDTATFYFMEYMEQEGVVHLLQFWLAAENFQKHLLSQQGQYDSGEAQSDAMVLYDQYFSLQATCPIGFDDSIRLEVETNICREGGPLPDCFATPMRKAYTTLETVYFPGFLQSQLYYKFLSELINTIKSEHAATYPGDTSVGVVGVGGTGSEDKPKSRNTLLAEGNVKKLFEESEMNMESLDSNPDLLWQRPDHGMMTFGKVNHLGQYVAEYEPDPEAMNKKSSSSKFSLKKLVKGEQDASKEEMALKIAQMIINDVNMQTGSSTPPPSPAVKPHPAPASRGLSPGHSVPLGSPRVKFNEVSHQSSSS
ncbi:A-kinase anchor protein 10, mitochondrial-like [Acanthaster planci]|uniref:A-kinase anchor protein 10, mitochondrial-like n=1 Tax=Acanthaster planci TaxID=133434 RepID=A0A8B7ZDY4_ACAPL|nr:A-kinase anchor protein 10, mitochondrial-like [Acanthaster planci]